MKGMVFTEFLEMIEATFSAEVVDQIIEASALSSHGVYTAVGSYDHAELIQLVTHLSEITRCPFHKFAASYAAARL